MIVLTACGATAPRPSLFRRLTARIGARMVANETRRALNALSARDLEDIGLTPGDVPAVVRDSQTALYNRLLAA